MSVWTISTKGNPAPQMLAFCLIRTFSTLTCTFGAITLVSSDSISCSISAADVALPETISEAQAMTELTSRLQKSSSYTYFDVAIGSTNSKFLVDEAQQVIAM